MADPRQHSVETIVVNLDPKWQFRTCCCTCALDFYLVERGVEFIDLTDQSGSEKLESALSPWPRHNASPRECVSEIRAKIDRLKSGRTNRLAVIFCLAGKIFNPVRNHTGSGIPRMRLILNRIVAIFPINYPVRSKAYSIISTPSNMNGHYRHVYGSLFLFPLPATMCRARPEFSF